MKTLLSIGALIFALPILQIPIPPPAPAPPPPPQRAPAAAQRVPLTAAECKCSIEVTVKRQSNGEPISDVSITANFNSPSPVTPSAASASPAARVVLTAMTDNAGHATFSNLAEGMYAITAQREGFFGESANGNAPTQVFTSASIGPAANNASDVIGILTTAGIAGAASAANFVAQPVQHVAINMVEGSIISGRIQDANHRPASGVPVVPFQVAYQNGQRILRQTATQVQTDDLGQFRLFWFAPGEYYLMTGLQPARVARGGGPNYPSPTYYPGTLELARSRPIIVREGQEISGTDFELQTDHGVTISGTVTNTLPGRVNPNGLMVRTISSYFLVPRNSSLLEPARAIPNVAVTGARGAAALDATEFPFEIRGVPPGSYDFYPIFNDGAAPRNNVYTGRIPLEVGSENITGIKTAIQPGVDLKIHVSVVGTPPATPVNRPAVLATQPAIQVGIRPADNLPNVLTNGFIASVPPDADGVITLANLPEARFFIATIPGLPADGYVSEMRQGSRSIMDDTIFSVGNERHDPVEIIISRNGGTIAGTLEDAQHKPLTGVRVFLIPDQPRRRNLLLYKTSSSGANGAFSFRGVAPGAYKLFAWDSIPQGAEQNEEFISRYDGQGSRVVASAGTPTANVQVSLIQGNR